MIAHCLFRPIPMRRQRGLTLIEVLVAVVVLGIGLLGLALLQTTTLRMIQSSNQRTIATELAYDAIDAIRAGGRQFVSLYSVASGGALSAGGCDMPADLSPASVVAHWQCKVATELPDGKGAIALANPGPLFGTATVTVTVQWTDSPWETNSADQITTFVVTSNL